MSVENLNPKKTVVFGDPCYVFEGTLGREDWLTFCEELFKIDHGLGNKVCKVEFYSKKAEKNITIWCASTKHGDGGYLGRKGTVYGVDSGLLGFISLEDAILVGALEDETERRSATSTIGLYNKTFEVSDFKNAELKIREDDWAIILTDSNTIIEEVPTDYEEDEDEEDDDWFEDEEE